MPLTVNASQGGCASHNSKISRSKCLCTLNIALYLTTAFQQQHSEKSSFQPYQLIIISSHYSWSRRDQKTLHFALHREPSHRLEPRFPESPALQRSPFLLSPMFPLPSSAPLCQLLKAEDPVSPVRSNHLMQPESKREGVGPHFPSTPTRDTELASGQEARESLLWPGLLRVEKDSVPSSCREPAVLSQETHKQQGNNGGRSDRSSWSDLLMR